MIKITGTDAAANDEIEQFHQEFKDKKIVSVIVTDDEHELLSLDANTQFTYVENDKVIIYNSIMEGLKDLTDDDTNLDQIHHILYMLSKAKFEQHQEAKKILMSIKDGAVIVYKTENDNYWGSQVPQFDGKNLAGIMLMQLREEFKLNN